MTEIFGNLVAICNLSIDLIEDTRFYEFGKFILLCNSIPHFPIATFENFPCSYGIE